MLFVGRQAISEPGRVDRACIPIDSEPVPVHLIFADGKSPAEIREHRLLEAFREPVGEVGREVDKMFAVPRERGEVGVRDHRTIGGRVLHVQPVYAAGYVPVECEGHAGGALVRNRGDIESGEVRSHLQRECRDDGVVGLVVDKPAVAVWPDLRDGGVEHDRGAPLRCCFFESGDEVSESPFQVAQALAPDTPVGSDCDAGYEPGRRDFARTIPEFAL